jgi:DNA polymerase bacteriophage-type
VPPLNLHLDFETYCALDLKKVGVYRTVEHPSFRVWCVAWMFEGHAVRSMTVGGSPLPQDLCRALGDANVQAHAFNAAFETAVLARLGVHAANPIHCTMQRALAYGLPGKLEHAAAALGLKHQKDMAGHRLMLKMSRPLPPKAPPWTVADRLALAAYCAKDVEAEAALSAVIPALLPEEWELSQLDADMNALGELGVDIRHTSVLRDVAEAAEKADAARCAELTGGMVTSPGTQTERLSKWLTSRGWDLPNMERATIEEALPIVPPMYPDVIEVLQIRLRMARASTRKLARMEAMCSGLDSALQGQFQFVGAGRTGRWSGRGVQVQNLPRVPKDFSPGLFADMAYRSSISGGIDAVAPFPVLDCVSWSLRACLKATDNEKMLWSFDFSQIEARVLAWLAGQSDVLAVFASGMDVYVWAARQFGSDDRQLGKVLVLALGFGMGAVKLRDTAWKNYGVRLSAGQAERFKAEWRHMNYKIVNFWGEMNAAAQAAILRRGSGHVAAAGGSGVAFTCTGKTLQLRLPSGRVLYYHRPRIDHGCGGIVYWGTEAGKPWHEQRTWGGKLAENATQACARDIMAEAMLRVARRIGNVPCMTVHDELVYAVPRDAAEDWLRALYDVVLEPPPWAGGLPLAGESKIMRRYGTAAP